MNRSFQPALFLFAVGMAALGVLALIYGDFAMVWQPVAPWIPGRTFLAYLSGVVMIECGIALLFERTATFAVRILFPYLVLWLLLKVPALVVAPGMEAVWLGFGEIAVLFSGGWILFSRLSRLSDTNPLAFATGERGIRYAHLLFAIALIPIGFSHLIYIKQTVELVPAWLPYRIGFAYLTGVGQIACGLGMLLRLSARLAAATEGCMLSIFAILVWMPAVAAAPTQRLPWTALFITWVIAASAWLNFQSLGQSIPSPLGPKKV